MVSELWRPLRMLAAAQVKALWQAGFSKAEIVQVAKLGQVEALLKE